MSDYENIKRWKELDIRNATEAIEKFTANIAIDTAHVAEFSETNPDVAEFYRNWIADHSSRLRYFQNRLARLTTQP